ncbi:MAG: hypothetical protein RR140_00465 [Clostridia bacterium]
MTGKFVCQSCVHAKRARSVVNCVYNTFPAPCNKNSFYKGSINHLLFCGSML